MQEWTHVDKALPPEYTPVACLAKKLCGNDDELYLTAGVLHECGLFYVFDEDGQPEAVPEEVVFWKYLTDDWKKIA